MDVVGVDVSTRSCSSSHLDGDGGIKQCLEFANDSSGWRVLEAALSPDSIVVLEAGTAAFPLHDYLKGKGHHVVTANPRRVRMIAASPSKTDRKDSLVLAQLYRLGYLPEAHIPSPEILRIRDLVRAAIDVGRELTRTKNRVHALLTRSGLRPEYRTARALFASEKRRRWLRSLRFGDHRDAVLQALLVQLEALEVQRRILHGEIAAIGTEVSEVDLLMSIKGVDTFLALVIHAEIGDVRRFLTADALCAYAGLVPRVRQSGDVVVHGRITKQGPSTLRWAVEMAARVAVRHDNPIGAKYRALRHRKKKAPVAKTAVAHKMLRMIHAMLTRGERCRWEDARATDVKVMKMRRRARARKVSAG